MPRGADQRETSREVSPADAFSILGNETRVEVLRALLRAGGPTSYADLRRGVAYDGGGNFNYHLDKLVPHFVRKTEEGYVLRPAGEQVAHVLESGVLAADGSPPEAALDEPCARCGGTLEVRYEGEAVTVRCVDCTETVGGTADARSGGRRPSGTPAPPSRGAGDDAASVLHGAAVATVLEGVCPECGGSASIAVDVCPDHDAEAGERCSSCETRFEAWAVAECESCRFGKRFVAWVAALYHSAVVAFLEAQGVGGQLPLRPFAADGDGIVRRVSTRVLRTDPYRFGVRIRGESERLDVRLDETLAVRSVDRRRLDEL